MGHKNLLAYNLPADYPYEVVKTGQSLSLGKKTVQFLETRMLHWPDSMFSYFRGQAAHFQRRLRRALGHQRAVRRRGGSHEFMVHARQVLRQYLAALFAAGSKTHGEGHPDRPLDRHDRPGPRPDLERNPAAIVEAYDRWSQTDHRRQKAVVIYDTMWKSTETMAQAIADGLIENGISTKVHESGVNHRSDVMTEMLDAKAVVVGSSDASTTICCPAWRTSSPI